MTLDERWGQIELLLSDVDGVLTDGRLSFDNQGIESKQFHIRDGMGIRLWQRAGHRFGLVTARSSQIVKSRAAELGIDIVRQGFEDKLAVVKQIVAELKLAPHAVCYVGDDLPDLAPIRYAGIGAAVADATAEARLAAAHVTSAPGGHGAVRELIETILKAQGRWEAVVQTYGGY
jgi:YrbI family 3-deoxy-D-manno-octulosonate 8-phosphate phosphatase